jgi:hypothetical protein
LATLVGGLNRCVTDTSAVNQTGCPRVFWLILDALNNGEQAACEHQKDEHNRHGKSLSVFDVLDVLFGQHTGTS